MTCLCSYRYFKRDDEKGATRSARAGGYTEWIRWWLMIAQHDLTPIYDTLRRRRRVEIASCCRTPSASQSRFNSSVCARYFGIRGGENASKSCHGVRVKRISHRGGNSLAANHDGELVDRRHGIHQVYRAISTHNRYSRVDFHVFDLSGTGRKLE